MTFLDQLKKLNAEATQGPWENISAFTAHGTEYASINDDYMTNLDESLICLLRNNSQAIIELVDTCEKAVALYEMREEYLKDEMPINIKEIKSALSKLKGDV